MQSEHDRRRNTLWARRKRDRALDRTRQGHTTCPARRGHYGTCGGVLEHVVHRDGRVTTHCPRCDRKRQGLCQDCGQRVEGAVGKARRCAVCKHKEKLAAVARYRDRDPEQYRRKAQRNMASRRSDPVRHAHDLAVKKAWRQRNVVRIKMGKRKWRLNPDRPSGYSSREKWLAYHAAYRKKHAAHRRELAKRRYYELHPDRPHPVCACGCEQPIPWDGSGRPAKWLREHSPHPRSLTAKESFMKGTERAIAMLERTAEKTRAKLAGVKELQEELAAIEQAIQALRGVAGSTISATRRGRAKAAAA